VIDFATFDCPLSPTTPFEFPFDPKADKNYDSMLAELPDIPSTMDSVMRVFGTPRVCGLVGDSQSTVWVTLLAALLHFSSVVDGGMNICLTGNTSLLVDVVDLLPLPVLVADEGDGMSMADCCTKPGLLPLKLENGRYTIKRATIAPTLLKQSYRLKPFLMVVIYLSNGLKRDTRMTVQDYFAFSEKVG
jgi:hypothetical protein